MVVPADLGGEQHIAAAAAAQPLDELRRLLHVAVQIAVDQVDAVFKRLQLGAAQLQIARQIAGGVRFEVRDQSAAEGVAARTGSHETADIGAPFDLTGARQLIERAAHRAARHPQNPGQLRFGRNPHARKPFAGFDPAADRIDRLLPSRRRHHPSRTRRSVRIAAAGSVSRSGLPHSGSPSEVSSSRTGQARRPAGSCTETSLSRRSGL